ncbi:MAG: cobyrinate a,c-diamide synthase [Oscillospiraceae bacterium]|nr:cobyrinate a,c-diamide synthase [Oscillospiraceae bacterium]
MNDRVLIAGTRSGCGKTTVTCALLQALKRRNVPLHAYKCGPDYIDPMFHRKVLGVPSGNLDPFFLSGEALCRALGAAQGSVAVIEGVMGYYDGAGSAGRYSTWDVSQATDTPAILVVDVRGMYTSAAAVMQGFRNFRQHSGLQGVIFNDASPALYGGLKELAVSAGLTPLGFLPRSEAVTLKSRHLGLLTAGEIDDLTGRLEALGDLAERYLDLEGVLSLASGASALPTPEKRPAQTPQVTVAVARDEAFCFLYEENLRLLEALGARLVFFSPLNDRRLPPDAGGLYLPGGYPELYAARLSANPIRGEIADAIAAGMPTVAECGGFLYLHDTLEGEKMAGVIHAEARRTERLCRFGYATLRARRDNLLCPSGEAIRVHEFHYCDTTDYGDAFTARKPDGREQVCVHATDTLWAGFPHLYFPANEAFAERFVRKAARYAPL